MKEGPMKHKKAVAFGALGLALIGGASFRFFVWNHTPSIPVGLYLRTWEEVQIGSTVAFPAPPQAREYAIDHGGNGTASKFIKPLVAGPGEEVCVFTTETGSWLIIDNRAVVSIRQKDRDGKDIPRFMDDDCRKLGPDEWLPIGHHPDSYDGRYFGPIHRADMLGSYKPWIVGD